MKILLYSLVILLIPGGLLWCWLHRMSSKRRRLRERQRINRLTQTALDELNDPDRYRHRPAATWNRSGLLTGTASNYVPDWAKPEDEKRKTK